jgi:hypothetical protein
LFAINSKIAVIKIVAYFFTKIKKELTMDDRERIYTLNKREMVKDLDMSLTTFYNWRKYRPKVFDLICSYYKGELESLTPLEQEMLKYFRELSNKDQEIQTAEMKLRNLKSKP